VGQLHLANPTILASGILGVTAGGLAKAWRGGAGAVVTKTVGPTGQPGYPGPRIAGLDSNSLINAMGLPNPGIDGYLLEVEEACAQGIVVIGSVMGDSPDEFASVASKLATAGVAAIELNVSCPHVGSIYVLGLQPDHVANVVSAVSNRVGPAVPVWVKLPGSTDYPRLVTVAKAAEKAGAAAIVAINTLPALVLDIDVQRPVLGGGIGGLSGPAIRPVAVRVVWELHRAGVSIPIVGAGGVITGRDAVEFLLAGARAVEVGTGVIFRGPTVFKRICHELEEYLQHHGIKTLNTLVGRAHQVTEPTAPMSAIDIAANREDKEDSPRSCGGGG
jgi:dihydroorotate dehydrogenase (NAD+) catalytic subunit